MLRSLIHGTHQRIKDDLELQLLTDVIPNHLLIFVVVDLEDCLQQDMWEGLGTQIEQHGTHAKNWRKVNWGSSYIASTSL